MHIYSFPQGLQSQVYSAIQTFEQRGVTSILLDLRANTGGDHQTILTLLSYFIKSGTVESETDRNGQSQPFTVDGSTYWKSPKPVVVLVDDDTQSGGELFAKAMQEEGGYPIFGMKTAGCAASARTFDLGDGSAIEISTGKIVSGKGADINRTGVTPDQVVDYPVTDLAAGRDPQLGAAAQAAAARATSGQGAAAPMPASASPQAATSSAPASGQPPPPSSGPAVIKPLIKPNGVPVLK